MCCFHGDTLISCISYQIDVDVLYILYVETFIYVYIYTLIDVHVKKQYIYIPSCCLRKLVYQALLQSCLLLFTFMGFLARRWRDGFDPTGETLAASNP